MSTFNNIVTLSKVPRSMQLLSYVDSVIVKYSNKTKWDFEELLEFIWDFETLPQEFLTDYDNIYEIYKKDIHKLTPKINTKGFGTDKEYKQFKTYCAIMSCVAYLSQEYGIGFK